MRKKLFIILIVLLVIAGALFLVKNPQILQGNSLQSFEPPTEKVQETSSLAISTETDLSQEQDGSSFLIKVRYTNSSDTVIHKSLLTTTVKDSFGTTLDRFSNNSLIKAQGGNIYNSVRVPNIPGAIYYINCHTSLFECSPLRIELPGAQAGNLDIAEETDNLEVIDEPVVSTSFQKSPVDFELIQIYTENSGVKTKVTLEYRQNSHDSFTGSLQYQYKSVEQELGTSFLTTIPEKTYDRGKFYKASFYVSELEDFEIVLDPNEKTADPVRTNNVKKYHVEDTSSVDLMLNQVNSRIVDHDGKKQLKLYFEYKNVGLIPVDSSVMALTAQFPYLDSEQRYDSIGTDIVNPGQTASFTAFIPLQYQSQPFIARLDHELDNTPGNNRYETSLDALGDESYTDITAYNAAAKIVDDSIKIYTEYSQKSDQIIIAPITVIISDYETRMPLVTREISFDAGYPFENNVLYSFEELLPYAEYSGKTIMITFDPDRNFNDPYPVNNSTVLVLP